MLEVDAIIEVKHIICDTDESITNLNPKLMDYLKSLKSKYNIEGDLDKLLEKCFNKNDREQNIKNIILDRLPIISYSDDRIDLLKDSIKIYEYDNNKNKFKTITNFLMLSGLKIEELSGKKGSDRRRYTEDASSKITNMFKGSWNQAKIRVDVWIDGDEIHFGIEDESGIKEVPPTKRSDGFQWYLAFYINFMAGAKGDLRNSILLLDNPGLQLHPSGQKDLLSVLEELSKENQIIYTTHSPYLIDIEHLDKVRIIEKHNDNGTIINEKYYCSDLDSLKPIRDSLGFTLKDSLFISDENIIVEGPSDKYIIEGMLSYLRDSFDWDPSKLAINSPGGANKIPYYAFFMASEGLKFVAILDNDNAGDLAAKELKKNPNLSETQIIKIDQIVNIKDITIEDLINPDFYNLAVNSSYKDILKKKLNIEEIDISEINYEGFGLADKYSKFFYDKKLGKFDKILVARRIKTDLENGLESSMIGEKTIENFKKIFSLIKEGLADGAS